MPIFSVGSLSKEELKTIMTLSGSGFHGPGFIYISAFIGNFTQCTSSDILEAATELLRK